MLNTTCSENVCVPKALHVECEILGKKSLLPFLQIRLIYAVNGPNKLNKSTNQRRRRRARRRSGRSHSATAEGEGGHFGGWRGARRHLSIYRLLGPSRSFSLGRATTRSLSLSLAIPPSLSLSLTITRSLTLFFGPSRSLSPLLGSLHSCSHSLHGPSHSLPFLLTISGHHTAPLTTSRTFSLFLAIVRSLSLPPTSSHSF